MKAICLLVLVAVSGCGTHELATAQGPIFALNPDRWQWTSADLVAPAAEAPK